MVARLQAAETRRKVGRRLYLLNGLRYYGVDLRHLLLYVALGDFKQLSLGLLQHVVHVDAFVERLGFKIRSEAYELARKIFLRHDARVELHIGRRSHLHRELRHIGRAADAIQCAVQAQLLDHGEHVDGALRGAEGLNSLIYALMGRFVETVGVQYVANNGVGVLLKHESAKHGSLEACVARSYALAAARRPEVLFCWNGGIMC